jgi:flagellar motility protein MotE (MotC chaperone)
MANESNGTSHTKPAMLAFICSVVASACLAMMTYVFLTGRLPFGLQTLAPTDAAAEDEDVAQPIDESIADNRPEEGYALQLYKHLDDERRRVANETDRLADREQQLLEIERNLSLREAELLRIETRVAGLLNRVEATEVENTKQLGDLLAATEPTAGAKMLLEMDEQLAARVLYFMNERASGDLISAIMKEGDGGAKNAVRMLEKLHLISSDGES